MIHTAVAADTGADPGQWSDQETGSPALHVTSAFWEYHQVNTTHRERKGKNERERVKVGESE